MASLWLRLRRNIIANNVEKIAQAFHESYERLAPDFGYKTREASAVPWEDVPIDNKSLMMSVVVDLIARGIIRFPTTPEV